MTKEITVDWMNRRQNQLLVHSFLYYQLDTSVISDHTFDLWSKELAEAMREYPEIAKKSYHYKAFKDFDGSSGFDLPFHHPEVQNRGYHLLKHMGVKI